jgi:hypothetical protein
MGGLGNASKIVLKTNELYMAKHHCRESEWSPTETFSLKSSFL